MRSKTMFEPLFLITLSILVFIAGTGVALAAPLAVFTAPAFFMIMERRYGPRAALLFVCLGTVLVFAMSGPVLAFVYLISMGLLGFIFGQMCGRFRTGGEFLLAATAASVTVKILLMALLYAVSGINLFYISPEAAEQITARVIETLLSSGFSLSENAARLYYQNLIDMVSMNMPSMLIIFSACDTFISYMISWKVIKKYGGGKIPSIPPFGLWKLPRNILSAFFVAVIADAAGRIFPDNRALSMVSVNILELLRILFFLEGLALCWYYMTAQGVNRIFKMVAAILCAALWPVSFIMSSLGFVDIWFDLRRHIRRK